MNIDPVLIGVIVAILLAGFWLWRSSTKDDDALARSREKAERDSAAWLEADKAARAQWAIDHPGVIYPGDLPPTEEA